MEKNILITSLWCPSCIIMRDRYQKIFKDKNILFEEIDYDENPNIREKYQVSNILPEMLFIKDDIVIRRIIGEKSKKHIIKVIEN